MPSELFWWLIFISVIAIGMTVYDKLASKVKSRSQNRIPEANLMAVAAIGGAAAMELTMLLIRHKTRHPKFMIGLPLIILVHAALIVYFFYLGGWPL